MKYEPPSFTYCGEYSCWEDIQKAYSMKEPEPPEVYLAWHGMDYGVGESFVYYRKGQRYFEVATLYDEGEEFPRLRGYWKPNSYGITTFLARLRDTEEHLQPMPDYVEYDLVRAVRHKILKRLEPS